MTRSEVFVVSLKLAAVYLWILALARLTNLGFFVRQLSEPDEPVFFTLAGILVPVALLAALGAALFLASPYLAARLAGGPVPASVEDRNDVGTLGLRIAAILILLQAADSVSRALFQIRIARLDGNWKFVWTDLAVTIVLAGIGACLFLRAERISRKHFGTPAVERALGSAPRWQGIAFSVVGSWILANVLPDLFRASAVLVASFGSDAEGDPAGLREDWTRTAAMLLRFALGLWLFFGGSGLAGLLHRIREGGRAVQRAGLEPRNRG